MFTNNLRQLAISYPSHCNPLRCRAAVNFRSIGLIALLLCTTLFVSSTVSAGQLNADRTILVMGDSISAGYGIQREQGWVHLLNQSLLANEYQWRAVNASVSGETTGGGLARLPALLEEHAPQMVLIELGGNDGLRGYPVDNIRRNLEQMVSLVKATGAKPVIMAMRIPPNYGPRYTRQFDGVFAEVAETTDSELVPFFLNDIALEPGMMQRDGIHPTAEAQPTLAATVQEALAPLLTD
ncbi:MAG: arylesterase [Pseudomonadales bacterium]